MALPVWDCYPKDEHTPSQEALHTAAEAMHEGVHEDDAWPCEDDFACDDIWLACAHVSLRRLHERGLISYKEELEAAKQVVEAARRATDEVWHDDIEDAIADALEKYDEQAKL